MWYYWFHYVDKTWLSIHDAFDMYTTSTFTDILTADGIQG